MCNNDMVITHYGKETKVRCRWCMGCRTDRISELSTRTRFEIAYLAAKLKVGSSFITCTYSDNALFDDDKIRHEHMIEHLQRFEDDVPYNPLSLYPNDFQKLIKKLRYFLHVNYPIFEKEFKVLWCGEYGEESTMRCHFHAILCGLPTGMVSDFLRKNWCSYGFVTVSPATTTRINYCLEYIQKQVHGDSEYKLYWSQGKLPPFCHISKGLGERYWFEHWQELCEHDGLINNNGRFVPVSAYFAHKFGFDLKEYSGRIQAKEIMRYELENKTKNIKRPEWDAMQRIAREKEMIAKARHQGITPPTSQIFSIEHQAGITLRCNVSEINNIVGLALQTQKDGSL